ncbi:hypothetical protein JCM10908_005014 [Rhodotorula pacifica]|uniref:uncharacterized protein n=1 Tax=Rhodotorula pacifica TaxID=1495444 RepID=UPI003181D561
MPATPGQYGTYETPPHLRSTSTSPTLSDALVTLRSGRTSADSQSAPPSPTTSSQPSTSVTRPVEFYAAMPFSNSPKVTYEKQIVTAKDANGKEVQSERYVEVNRPANEGGKNNDGNAIKAGVYVRAAHPDGLAINGSNWTD